MTAPPYDPMSTVVSRTSSSSKWRDAAYGCFSSGHKFCREVCPVMQVTRNENHTPTAFHANVVAMDQGHLSIADVADDYVHCTQCGACELRCPNTLFTGDFYRNRTQTVKLVKAMRALAVESGSSSRTGSAGSRQRSTGRASRCIDDPGRARSTSRDWADGLDLPIGGETILFVDCEAAFYRTARRALDRPRAQAGGRRVRADARAVVLRRAGGRDGLLELRGQFAEHNVADWRAVGAKRIIALDPHDYISFTEDYPGYFGDAYDFEIVYITELVAELIRDGRLAAHPADRARGRPTTTRAGSTSGRASTSRRARSCARSPG